MLCSGLDTRLRGYDKRSLVLYFHQNRLCQHSESQRDGSSDSTTIPIDRQSPIGTAVQIASIHINNVVQELNQGTTESVDLFFLQSL